MKISVCMATYNGEKYLREQIESILPQLGEKDELIISDDMSTDSTRDIILSYRDSRIRLLIHETNHGFVRNFENALSNASGDIIFLSDQDDVWLPGKVEKSLRELEKVDFTVSDCITVDDNRNHISTSRIKDFKIKTGFWSLMIRTRYLGCCMAFRKELLEAALPFPKNDYYMEHDLWLASVAECYFRTSLIDEPLIEDRRHGGNASGGGITKGYSIQTKVLRRLYRLFKLATIRDKVNKVKSGMVSDRRVDDI